MRRFLLSTAIALALLAARASPAPAQVIIINGDGSSPPGFYSITTPRIYSGLAVTNDGIVTFPSPSPFNYLPYGYPAFGPYPGSYPYPGRYPYYPGSYPRPGLPGVWRP